MIGDMKKAVLVGVACLLLGALFGGRLTPAGADALLCSDAPVKYLNCDPDGKSNCFLVARFKDMTTCESYRDRDMWYCGPTSESGRVVCEATPRPGRVSMVKCVR